MRSNIESEVPNQVNNKYIVYSFVIVCLSDWLHALLRTLIKFNLANIVDCFSYVFYLWRLNAVVTLPILVICLSGVPKFTDFLRNAFKKMQELLKAFMKNPIIINVPLYMFLLIFGSKSYLLLLSKSGDKNGPTLDTTTARNIYWEELRKGLTQHKIFSLMSIVLFLLGVYTLVTNRLVYRLVQRALTISLKQLKTVYSALSMSVPTPFSLLMLVALNTISRLFPPIALRSYRLLTNRSFILFAIVLVCLFNFLKWFWSDSKFKIDLTSDIYLDDVSRLNKTRISSLFYPRTLNDIQYLISKAKFQGKTISIRGQAHTMGGQTLPAQTGSSTNYVLDLKYMNRVEYDEMKEEVLVEAGATWTHVIKKLNSYGRSPVVMQSYCTFSVAGTISVNAHGITCDDAMCESVLSIEYIDVNGTRGECNRETNPELFSLIIGGYGLFAIITRLRLKTVPNARTVVEYIRLQSDQFSTYYERFFDDPTIEIKLARVDLIRPNNILMFIFRRQLATSGTIADLSDEARVMHPRQHLIYTYLAQHQPFRRIRFAIEKILARPLDLSLLSTDRNTTMYESAKSVALLYQPLTYYDDTFILQEYFVPKPFFRQWYDKLKPIIRRQYEHVFLLNLTIRYVKNDQTTFLSYTKNHDCYAFVFYFRIKRSPLGDHQAQELHQKLIQLTFDYQGTFYLPYRQHYSYEQLAIAYPMIGPFFEKKLTYDPIGLLSNAWYEHYRRNKPTRMPLVNTASVNDVELITDEFQIVEQRRSHSFRAVIENELFREKFRKFLRTVFNAEPMHVIFNYVNRAVRNPANENDHDIYRELQQVLKTRQFASIRRLFALVKQFRQLRIQVKDMLRQQLTIFKHLGYCGKIKDIVSIGDGGRCIGELRRLLKINDGRVFVMNDQERPTDILERNSLFPIGTFIPYDFKNLADAPIPSASIDLVVCYMGLHHLPQEQLRIFLKMIHRILRPNGLFLFREHHAYQELVPLLDVAHMVFNVVTGVDYESEINEIRAFRTIEQWRSCLRQVGFEDTFVYDEQTDDPTDDIMIVVRKSDDTDQNHSGAIECESYRKIGANPESNYFRPCEWLIVRIAIQFSQSLNHTPFYLFPYMKFLSIFWSLFRTETELAVAKFGLKTALIGSPGFMMNLFVGILLSISFFQLAFVALLVRFVLGVDIILEYEQLVLQQTEEIGSDVFDFNESIDQRIDEVQVLKEKGHYAVRVPRHHAFTSILKKLAAHSAKFNLLLISKQDGLIQVEVTVNNNDEQRLLWLKQRSNMDIVFEYKNPTDDKQTHFIIRVKIQHLLTFIRECIKFEADNSLTIIQIFDHFGFPVS